jgi:predicted acyl esterase
MFPLVETLAQPAFTPGAGTENRRWLPELPTARNPALRYSLNITDNVKVIMRDGVKLDGRLIAPVLSSNERTPCVLMTDGYGRRSATGALLEVPLFDIAARGYPVLHLSLRGSGESEGSNDYLNQYGSDGYDAIEWMAKQPWCNGNVGMVGASLLGISQWLAAKEAPPSLKAIVPEVACGDCYGVLWYPGGMLPGPGREARRGLRAAPNEFPSAVAHRDFDAWWRSRTTLADDHAAIARRGIAAFIAGGLDDYISPANIRAYEEFTSSRKRLFVGPYAHAWHTEYFQELQIQWLDHWLKGIDNGAEREPRVVIYVKGANRWRYEDDWPIADARPVKLFLQALNSGSIASLNDGALTSRPSVSAWSVSLPYTPEDGPFLPAMLSATARLAIDQKPDEEKVLTWTSAPLSVATEVTGYPKLSIWAESSAADGDFVAELNDVAPDGKSHQVVQAYRNAPHADIHGAAKPLTPGAIEKYDLEFYPTAYVFQPGHRMRVAVAGGAKVAPNQLVPQGPGKNPIRFTWTFHCDSQRSCALELPIVGTSSDQLALTSQR